MASWALEGLIEEVLADTADGRWLRERVEFLMVSLMDLDGVEDGDQGKNRSRAGAGPRPGDPPLPGRTAVGRLHRGRRL